MRELLQTITLGLLIGGVYALMSSGLTLIFGVMRIVNIAQGALLVLAALFTFELWTRLGLDPLVSIIVTTPAMFALGWVIYRLFVSRIRTAPASTTVLLTFALAITLEGSMGIVWSNLFRAVTPGYFASSYRFFGLIFPKAQVYGFVTAVLVLVALYLLLTRTWVGRAIRASSENPDGARLVGVSIGGVSALTFAIGVATTGAGGSIMSILYTFYPAAHYHWIARLLGIIVLGGLGSLPGAVVASLLLGLAETITSTYVSVRWSIVLYYVVIMVVLLARPQGLLGSRVREDVAS